MASRVSWDPARPAHVFLAYLVIALVMTWPLAAGVARDVPGDLGDSLLNMWILAWGAEHLPRVVLGEMSLADFWNANIFHPEPLALAFSETLFGQVLQVLPIYQLTGNIILCYNLLFLSTFVLSGLGMYLLVREFTHDHVAAFVAGLLFAFVPYRIAQVAHIQTLSSQWMPLALYGFRRYLTTSRPGALAGGSASQLMLNWSCGYFLIYFAPFVLLFVLHQMLATGRAREWRVWAAFAAAATVVGLATWPILALYLQAQRVHDLARPLAEIVGFSANVLGYLTAPDALRLLGTRIRAWPRPEGALFPGFIVLGLAGMAVAASLVDGYGEAKRAHRSDEPSPRAFRSALTIALVVVTLALTAGLIGVLFTGGFITSFAGVPIRATNAPRQLAELTAVVASLLAVSARCRAIGLAIARSPAGIAAGAALAAAWLSLGPVPQTGRVTITGFGLYNVLLEHVPGFAGLRVPARYAMIVDVFLIMLAGLGASWLLSRPRLRPSRVTVAAALCAAFIAEAWFAPMPVNQTWNEGGATPPARVEPASRAPAVYRHLASLPGSFAILEFPFGDPAWELRYVYYSTVHWKRLVNGYSGGFPQAYRIRMARFERLRQAPDDAWAELRAADVNYVVVHEGAMPANESSLIRRWLESHGFEEVGRFGDDLLFATRM